MFFQTNKENGRGAGEGKANLLKLKTIKDDFFSESSVFSEEKIRMARFTGSSFKQNVRH